MRSSSSCLWHSMHCHGDADWNIWVREMIGTHNLSATELQNFSACWVLCSSPPPFHTSIPAPLWTHLPNIIEALFVEDRVNLGVLESAEQQRLPVVLGPVVEIQHPHSGEVHPVGIQRQQVNVLHQVLHRQMETHHCWHPWLPAKALTAVGNRAGTSKAAQNINKQRLPRHHCLEFIDHSKSNLLDFLPQKWKLPSL